MTAPTLDRTVSVRAQIMQAIDANPDTSDEALARELASHIGHDALLALAVQHIERVIKGERRKRIRDEEEASTGPGGDALQWSTVDALLEEYRKAVIVNWTAELLASEFAIGDGTRVTWGTATVEQHAARISMLTKNVRGNLDAIQRHEAAIATIKEQQAGNLAQAVGA